MSDLSFPAGMPASIRAQRRVEHESAMYRARLAAGLIDANGNPTDPAQQPQYDGHGRRIS